MTQQRYFYTDPLAAAWMAKHFGMEFEDLANVFESADDFAAVVAEHDGPFFIDPDSLHLLEPKDGDIGEEDGRPFKFGGVAGGWSNGDWDRPRYPNCSEKVRISKRRGLAFHWPESSPA